MEYVSKGPAALGFKVNYVIGHSAMFDTQLTKLPGCLGLLTTSTEETGTLKTSGSHGTVPSGHVNFLFKSATGLTAVLKGSPPGLPQILKPFRTPRKSVGNACCV